jgi:Protein tyrosine and serine/threonine kinase
VLPSSDKLLMRDNIAEQWGNDVSSHIHSIVASSAEHEVKCFPSLPCIVKFTSLDLFGQPAYGTAAFPLLFKISAGPWERPM